jgi:hypothetical protein
MTRKWLMIPALLIGAGAVLAASPAKADVFIASPVRVAPRVVVAPAIVPAPIYPRPIVTSHYHHHHHLYRVLYRECSHDPWHAYGVYRSFYAAREISRELRLLGYQVRVLD